MELNGVIKSINETQTFGSNGFRKREVVVTTQEQYPQHILVEFVQDKCDLLNNFAEGQQVTIGINLRGREWTNPQGEVKYFNSVQGWRIVSSNQTQEPVAEYQAQQVSQAAQDLNGGQDDSLPF